MTYVDNQQRLDDLLDRLNAGMSIRAALADMGYTGKSIGPVYRSIRAYAEDKQPDALEMLPENLKAAAKQTATVKIDGPIRIETETPDQVEIQAAKITKPLNYDGFDVAAVKGEYGRYNHQDINGKQWLDYNDNENANEISMTVDQWRGFLDELRRAAQVLGVEL